MYNKIYPQRRARTGLEAQLDKRAREERGSER